MLRKNPGVEFVEEFLGKERQLDGTKFMTSCRLEYEALMRIVSRLVAASTSSAYIHYTSLSRYYITAKSHLSTIIKDYYNGGTVLLLKMSSYSQIREDSVA